MLKQQPGILNNKYKNFLNPQSSKPLNNLFKNFGHILSKLLRSFFFIAFILSNEIVRKIEELIHRNIHLPKSHPNIKSGVIKVNCINKTLSFNFLFKLSLSPIKICAQININSIQTAGIQINPPPSNLLNIDNGKLIPLLNVQDRDPIAPEGKKGLMNCSLVITEDKFNQD